MLKAVRKKKIVKNKGTSVRLSADFFDRNFCRSKGNGTIYSKYWGKKKKTVKFQLVPSEQPKKLNQTFFSLIINF